ncbi:MAG: hypothetical protein K2H37_01975 [Lachnospiraceae bacterium]|nr:hypothetical protein [Lachnospiraceae bacterium]
MWIFNYANLKDYRWDSEILGLVAQIHEFKGKQELYLKQEPAALEKLLAAYRDFDTRISLVDDKLPAIEMVRKAVCEKIGKFTKSEIMELVPSLSNTSVENSLTQLMKAGVVDRHGRGKATFYTRTDV